MHPWCRVTFKFWELLKNASVVTLVPKNFIFLKILNLVQSFVECKVSLADGTIKKINLCWIQFSIECYGAGTWDLRGTCWRSLRLRKQSGKRGWGNFRGAEGESQNQPLGEGASLSHSPRQFGGGEETLKIPKTPTDAARNSQTLTIHLLLSIMTKIALNIFKTSCTYRLSSIKSTGNPNFLKLKICDCLFPHIFIYALVTPQIHLWHMLNQLNSLFWDFKKLEPAKILEEKN